MAINIALALQNVDFNQVNMTFVDGLSIDKLKIRYNWIFNAVFEDAILGEDDYGLVWYSGKWIDGEWYDGTWYSGTWVDGVWKNGNFYSYKLNKYDIINGKLIIINKNDDNSIIQKIDWENGNFYGGIFGTQRVYWENYNASFDPEDPLAPNDITNNVMKTSIWRNGNFYGGIFYNSIWYDGNWYAGYMDNIQWFNGKFYNGKFNGHSWYNGVFLGGDFLKGDWYGGTFTMFDMNVKSRFGCTVDRTPNSINENKVSGITDWAVPTLYLESGSGLTWNETNLLNKLQNPLSGGTVDTETHITTNSLTSSKILTLYGFNFNIPTGSEITGFEVRLSLYKDVVGSNTGDTISDVLVSISEDPIVADVYENKATFLSVDTGSTYTWNYTYGGDLNLWGRNWLLEEINSDEFCLNLRVSLHKEANDIKALLSGAQIKIYYQYPKYNYDYNICNWYGGSFNNGEFYSGLYTDNNGNSIVSENHNYTIWHDGTFNNGKWFGGKFNDGVWNNGEFYGGFFGSEISNPNWNDGRFYNGYFVNGNWYNGDFHGGIVRNINYFGGKIGD